MNSQQKRQQRAEKEEEQLTKKKLPAWLDILLRTHFFKPCPLHSRPRKIDKNVFCIDCHRSLCSHCLLTHSPHRLLQIRRYVYHDVVQLDDAQKLLDCSQIQPYISNGAKVVFLNQRPTTRPSTHSGNNCGGCDCDRIVQKPFHYCCISCKVDHILKKEGIEALYGYLRRCDSLTLNDVVAVDGTVDGLRTPDSVLEPSSSVSVRSSSNSSGAAANANAVVSDAAAGSGVAVSVSIATATTGADSGRVGGSFPRKKRTPKFPVIRVDPVVSSGSGGCDETHNVSRRKKGVPQRSVVGVML